MMRAPNQWAVACRRPDGSIITQRNELPKLSGPFGWRNSRWQMLAFETRRGTFHDMVRDGWPTDAEIAADSHSAGLLEVAP